MYSRNSLILEELYGFIEIHLAHSFPNYGLVITDTNPLNTVSLFFLFLFSPDFTISPTLPKRSFNETQSNRHTDTIINIFIAIETNHPYENIARHGICTEYFKMAPKILKLAIILYNKKPVID